ncbi:S1C family serine protease [Nonomuraea harbinensis]|uniref:S1C family serine protease n=1 Tax=Nonomuraea harbinensis TaxID=1286938 RepID=A0ABW1BV51_9ACTN|nr:trypsin-like peptidase domain-containing protein [Nonomuraea harbinensis]
MNGLGRPSGPAFTQVPLAVPPPSRPVEPARRGGRLLVTAVLVAAVTGTAAGLAGAAAFRYGEPATALPRAAPAASGGATGLSATAAMVLPSVVSVEAGRAGGSGFVVDGSGHVLTNAHVVRGASDVTVVLSDGRRLGARVLGSDDDEDLAVLEVAGAGSARLPPATLGRSADLSVGEQVLAIGSPLGLSGTVTAGIVSATDREVRLGGASRTAVQTDASINPGNSGGPLVNARGEVVGVNTAIAAGRGGGNIGIGFAIPIDRAAPIADRLIRN